MEQKNDPDNRTLEQLRALSATIDMLTRATHLTSSEVLEIVHQQISNLLDADNMYLTLCDEAHEIIEFALVFLDGKRIDVAAETDWQPRRGDRGRIEEIIRTRKPIFYAVGAENEAGHVQPEDGEHSEGATSASWLGVPVIVGERVLGAIATYHPIDKQIYSRDDLEILHSMAQLTAIALLNVELVNEKDEALGVLRVEQRKNIAAARLAAVNTIATEFVHTLNNVAGTIPARIEQIKELLNPNDPNYQRIAHFLVAMSNDVDGILGAVSAIRSSTVTTEPELVDVGLLISSAIRRISVPEGKVILKTCDEGLPRVRALSGQLADTLENIIRNGLEAITESGTVTVGSRKMRKETQDWVVIDVVDTGCGIPAENLPRVFDLFFTTKTRGQGFALWKAKALIESLEGRITVSSEVGKGTRFTILLPASRESGE